MNQHICHSCFYDGNVEHHRTHPRGHRFDYPLYFFGFDLSELPVLDRRLTLFGYNRLRPYSIYDEDYGIAGEGTILDKLVRQLSSLGLPHTFQRVVLFTSARYFNYVFNPVSFYFCYGEKDQLLGVMTEVNNTFGERHQYPLFPKEGVQPGESLQLEVDKAFHVSPFNSMEGRYAFSFRNSPDSVEIQIDLIRDEKKMFEARLNGRAVPLTGNGLLKTLVGKPLTPHKTMPRILWEALRLSLQRRLPVYTRPAPSSELTVRHRRATWWQKLCQTRLLKLLKNLTIGHLELHLPDGTSQSFGQPLEPAVQLRVRDYRFFSRIVQGGHVAIGEGYMDGDWETNNLTRLLEVVIDNRDFLQDGNFQSASVQRFMDGLLHVTRANTRKQAKQNMDRHYSLNNDFFQLFLDTKMQYSSGLYYSEKESLEQAQLNKIDRVISLLGLKDDDHLLEIGCGWGSLALETVRQTGCRVTALTLSDAQYEWARRRVEEAGQSDRITVLKRDYRTLEGRFDHIVSIEMIEAVGHRGLSRYFASLDRLLNPGGRVVLQAITVPDYRYEAYRKGCDFIQKYIFPGGLCPSLTAITDAMGRSSSLVCEQVLDIGPSYGRTLKEWRKRFDLNTEEVGKLGFDRRFRRMWRYYLAYCEAGFNTRTLATLQMVLRRAGER